MYLIVGAGLCARPLFAYREMERHRDLAIQMIYGRVSVNSKICDFSLDLTFLIRYN